MNALRVSGIRGKERRPYGESTSSDRESEGTAARMKEAPGVNPSESEPPSACAPPWVGSIETKAVPSDVPHAQINSL